MAIEARTLSVGGMSVDLVRKSIKNLHLAVYPPDGRVRVAAPWHVSDDAIRLAIATRVAWIVSVFWEPQFRLPAQVAE